MAINGIYIYIYIYGKFHSNTTTLLIITIESSSMKDTYPKISGTLIFH
jgi:hypothetical protein